MEPTAVLQKIIDGHTLSTRESQHLLLSVIAGKVTAAQTGAMLTVLHMRGETVEEIAGFIRGLFDCDAHVSKDKGEISITLASEELVKQLYYLLLRFGIIARLSEKITP